MSGDTRTPSGGGASLSVAEHESGVIVLWLNRPGSRNALDGDLVAALTAQFRRTPARAFVLGSSDPRYFCSGADLRLDDAERAAVSDQLYDLYRVMVASPAPIVVAVEGPAVGGGAQLALAGDIRLGAPSASFRFPGPGHGLSVGPWGVTSLVGRGRALEICLTVRTVQADEALQIGLLNRVEDEPRVSALRLAEELGRLDRDAVMRTKEIVRTALRLGDALELEQAGNAPWTRSVEGLRSPRT